MNVSQLLRADPIAVGQSYPDKESALRALAELTASQPPAEGVSAEDIYRGLAEREELGSTGFGDGIAIPHCRVAGIDSFVVGFVTVPDGLDFDALDDEPVKLIVYIVGPEGDSRDHVKILSSISQTLQVPGACEEIVAQPTPEAALESYVRHMEDEVDTTDHDTRNLFYLVVQNEDVFEPLVQAFAGLEACSPVVLDSHNAGTFLANLPLFAGFWGDGNVKFSRIILATVEKRMTNEMIRRIEQITGHLDERDDMMLLVQSIDYAAGRLED